MKGPVTIDAFLSLEEEGRKVARLRAPAREVRRFHAAVRRFANAWCIKPSRRITVADSDQGIFLQFEAESEHVWMMVFSLRAHHVKGEFCLRGPNPERKRIKAGAEIKTAMDSLLKAWRLLPGAEGIANQCITVHLPKLADAGFDRYLEVVIDVMADH